MPINFSHRALRRKSLKGIASSLFFLLTIFVWETSFAKLKVVATTTTLADMARSIGGSEVEVSSVTKFGQDPHFVEAKPSYMVKLRNADLLFSVGLGLEIGWIGLVRRGSRNPKIQEGAVGDFAAGEHFQPIEVIQGKVDRSHGDVHPAGNPHFHLDPQRYLKVAQSLSLKLGKMLPEKALFFSKQYEKLQKKMRLKLVEWKERVSQSGVRSAISYHKSLNYFFQRFNIEIIDYLEPKPGVAPTAKHIVQLINKAKSQKVNCILNENYFEETAARRVQKEVDVKVVSVPVEVNTSYFDLIESQIKAIENCGKKEK